MLKKSPSSVLASLRSSTYRSVRLASSLAAALLDGLFEHPAIILASEPYAISHVVLCINRVFPQPASTSLSPLTPSGGGSVGHTTPLLKERGPTFSSLSELGFSLARMASTCPTALAFLLLFEGGSIGLRLRATFSPAHPLARRDVPLAQARAFQFAKPHLGSDQGCP